MTLVEIMIVVIIMATIATGVAVAVIPRWREAQVRQAQIDAMTLREAGTAWMISNGASGCPSVDDLADDGQIGTHGRDNVDPWGQPFVVRCEGDDVLVISAGPDQRLGTEDDIPETSG